MVDRASNSPSLGELSLLTSILDLCSLSNVLTGNRAGQERGYDKRHTEKTDILGLNDSSEFVLCRQLSPHWKAQETKLELDDAPKKSEPRHPNSASPVHLTYRVRPGQEI